MSGTVTFSQFTVILVRQKESRQSSGLNWWLEKSSKPNTVNVTGIPVYVGEDCLRRVFSKYGAIKSLTLYPAKGAVKESHLPRFRLSKGYQQADLEFRKEPSVQQVLSMKYDGQYTLYGKDDKVVPMNEVWKDDLEKSYNLDTATLLKSCTEFMQTYDHRKANEEKTNRKIADEPDEEGWITVTRNKFSRPPKAVKAHELKKWKKKNETKALLHFYKNQVGDSKMQRIRELKTKFEEDKKRIQEMRQQRKFKPY